MSEHNTGTEPQPTEPQPTEPQPTEPQPTEPQPTEPQPTEPDEFSARMYRELRELRYSHAGNKPDRNREMDELLQSAERDHERRRNRDEDLRQQSRLQLQLDLANYNLATYERVMRRQHDELCHIKRRMATWGLILACGACLLGIVAVLMVKP